MRFEWDENKNRLNKKKHGIDFKIASRVFYDINRLERPDAKHSYDEERYISLGLVDDVLFVVHTDRKDVIRIISARYATDSERSLYYAQFDTI